MGEIWSIVNVGIAIWVFYMAHHINTIAEKIIMNACGMCLLALAFANWML